MEIAEVARAVFGTAPFTARELIDRADLKQLPIKVQFAAARSLDGGARSLGHALREAPGIAARGEVQHVKLWQVEV